MCKQCGVRNKKDKKVVCIYMHALTNVAEAKMYALNPVNPNLSFLGDEKNICASYEEKLYFLIM